MSAKLRHCEVSRSEYGSLVIFRDGTISSNWPPKGAAFARIVADCGFDDPIEYIRHHDLSHAFLAEKMFDKPSAVLWAAAHGTYHVPARSADEERRVYYWQRFVKCKIYPLEDIWPTWAEEFHSLWNALARS